MRIESQRIGQYELQQRLHQDNAGETWQAYDTAAQRRVILKFFRTDGLDTAEALTGYLRRIEEVASLHHPAIIHIHNVQVLAPRSTGEPTPLICLAIEYVEGETLADYIASTSAVGKIPPANEVAQFFSSLAIALDSAHQRGVTHGNLKPTNILLNQKGEAHSRIGSPVLTDFALSKLPLKRQGSAIPFYLAPEQLKGGPTSERSDIYALGALLYELYTGTPPFRGSRPIAVMMQHINALPTSPDLVNPGVSVPLARVILRCLAKDPGQRFPNVTSLALALCQALRVPVPEALRRNALALGIPLLAEPLLPAEGARGRQGLISGGGMPPQEPETMLARSRRRANRSLAIIALLVLLFILGAGFGAMQLMQRNTLVPGQNVGRAFFLNSGQLNRSTTQGINDELQIDLANVPAPAAGKSYYAWLLGDVKQSEAVPLFLGRLTVEQGNLHALYQGDRQHTNLLALFSRFLITEDDAQTPSSNPLLDQGTWRYYAALPQVPDPADPLHFSMLDHLRHLLVESPELAIRGLHGGLSFWFAREAATVANLASTLSEDWHNRAAGTIHDQVIRILEYLDGQAISKTDLPASTPWLVDTQTAQVPLLGPAPKDADPPGYIFQNETPPGYVYLIQTHLNGTILAPEATADQHHLAVQINGAIDSARQALTVVYQDAKRLLALPTAQFLQASALAIMDDLATQAQYAYTGQPDPSTGATRGGSLWIYNNFQRLATFEVDRYATAKS
jgi:tRNA A-37 threonylcarbamoyl transferase component Bud32